MSAAIHVLDHRQIELGNRARLLATASSWYSLAVSIKIAKFFTFFQLSTFSNVLSGSYFRWTGYVNVAEI